MAAAKPGPWTVVFDKVLASGGRRRKGAARDFDTPDLAQAFYDQCASDGLNPEKPYQAERDVLL